MSDPLPLARVVIDVEGPVGDLSRVSYTVAVGGEPVALLPVGEASYEISVGVPHVALRTIAGEAHITTRGDLDRRAAR